MYPVHVFLSVLCQCGLQCIQPVKGAWNDRTKFQRLYPCWTAKPTAPDLCTKWRNISVSLVILFPAACEKHVPLASADISISGSSVVEKELRYLFKSIGLDQQVKGSVLTHRSHTFAFIKPSSVIWNQLKLGGKQVHRATQRPRVHCPVASAGVWLGADKLKIGATSHCVGCICQLAGLAQCWSHQQS